MGKYVLDTNVLLEYPEIFSNNPEDIFIIHTIVASELDNQIHNKYGNNELAYKARQARNAIKLADNKEYSNYRPIELEVGLNFEVNDDIILGVCKDNRLMLYTNDLAMQIKASSIEVEWKEYVGIRKEGSVGYVEVSLNHVEQAWFYENINTIDYDLKDNQYLLLKDSDTDVIIDKFKYTTTNGLKPIKYKMVNSKSLGKIKPRNIQQELLFDMIQDENSTIKVCTGKFGSGKDFIMIAHAINLIENGKFDKLIWVRNNVEVKNSREIGFLPGTITEKLFPYAAPIMDHVGGEFGLKMMIETGKVELQHLGFIRGRDIKNSIIYCSESENMSKEHIQLLMGRCSDNTVLYLNGDFKQVDDKVFESNSGLNTMISKLSGHENFGFVKLAKTERSKTASMADLLD